MVDRDTWTWGAACPRLLLVQVVHQPKSHGHEYVETQHLTNCAALQYVAAVEKGISDLQAAAKAENADGVTAAGAAIKGAAEGLISAANPPIVFN